LGELPKLWPHVLLATLLVTGVMGSAAAYALFGPTAPAYPVVEATLPERPLPPAADTLMADSANALPDLLADTVAPGANPTETLVGGTTPAPSRAPSPAPDASPASSSPALRPAPIAGLHTQSTFGRIPKIASDGRTAFREYARPHRPGDAPTVSLVIGGLGIDAATTRRAIEDLPPEVTLGFAAHAPNLQSDIDLARQFGHEVLLELPMEGATSDPGEPGFARMIRTGDETQALRNLDFLLSRAAGYFAVTPYNGDIFLGRADASAPILSRLQSSGLGFLSDPQLDVPTLAASAKAVSLPYRSGTMLIDETPDMELIARDLEALRALALTDTPTSDAPIGFGFAFPQTLDALATWIPTLSRAELVPASAAMK